MAINYAVRNLTIEAATSAGTLTLLENVDLELREGEVLGLIGESGSGKTTAARAMIGLIDKNLRVTQGNLALGDRTVATPTSMRFEGVRGRDIGMIFQSSSLSLDPLMKVGNQLREVIRRHYGKLPKDEVAERLESVLRSMGFSDPARVLRSYPHQLSGGMRQRVAIALAVVTGPRVIIADECTSALDVTTQDEVVQLLHGLTQASRASMLFVTHDLLLAYELCHRIAVMYAGHVVELGTADEVVKNPRHPYTKALLRAVPTWDDSVVEGIPGSPPMVSRDWQGCRFAPRCSIAVDECRERAIPWIEDSQGGGVRCDRVSADHPRLTAAAH